MAWVSMPYREQSRSQRKTESTPTCSTNHGSLIFQTKVHNPICLCVEPFTFQWINQHAVVCEPGAGCEFLLWWVCWVPPTYLSWISPFWFFKNCISISKSILLNQYAFVQTGSMECSKRDQCLHNMKIWIFFKSSYLIFFWGGWSDNTCSYWMLLEKLVSQICMCSRRRLLVVNVLFEYFWDKPVYWGNYYILLLLFCNRS